MNTNKDEAIKSFHIAGGMFMEAANTLDMKEAYFNAAYMYQLSNSIPDSIYAYEKCIQVKNFRPCHIKLASIYKDLEDFSNVQKYLHLAIKLDPNNPDAYTYLADTLNNFKFFEQAINMYIEATRRSASDPNLYSSLGIYLSIYFISIYLSYTCHQNLK
jgi:tetratricopeptide (TPR) repeat protein